MAVIPGVSDGELIRTTWGDAVADELNIRCIKKDGSMAMTAALTLVAANPTADNHAARKKYVDDLAVAKTGGTMTGFLTIDATGDLCLRLLGAGPYIEFYNEAGTARLAWIQGRPEGIYYLAENAGDVHRWYIDGAIAASLLDGGHLVTTGELRPTGGLDTNAAVSTGAITATGNITSSGIVTADSATFNGTVIVDPATGDHGVSIRSTSPYLSFYNEAGSTRLAAIQGVTGALSVISDGGEIRFSTSGTERMRLEGSLLLLGKTVSDANAAGVELGGGGSTFEGRINSTVTSATAAPNVYLRHMPSADASGQPFVYYTRASTGTLCGSVTQGVGNTINNNETSDYRLKNELGPIVDPVGTLMALQPKHLAWKEGGDEFDGFIAHEVDEVVPYAVTGVKDAVLPDDDEFNPGGVDPQQLDTGKLIPILTAALQDAHTQIAALTARLDALEARGLMATRLIGTDTVDPRLPALVIAATQGFTADDLAPGDIIPPTSSTWSAPFDSGVTVGNGTTVARYMQIGNHVTAVLLFTLGTTSAITGTVLIDPPVNADTAGFRGICSFHDTSASTVYAGFTQGATLRALNTSATYATYTSLSATVPFTWASTDVITVTLNYLAA